MGGVRETLERQIRALSGQVESVDRSVAEVSTRVDAVGTW